MSAETVESAEDEGPLPEGGPRQHARGGAVTPEEHESLADALCEISYVQDAEGQRDLLHCFPTRIRQEVSTGPTYRFALQLVSACARRRRFLHLTRWVLRRDGGSIQAQAFAEEAAARVREEEEQVLGPMLARDAAPEPEIMRGDLTAVRRDLALIPCQGETRDGYRTIRASHGSRGGDLPPPETLWDALVNLAELPAIQDPPPTARFCALVARVFPRLGCCDLLSRWGSTDPTEALPPAPPETLPARLVVRVSRSRADRFDLESWTVLSRGRGEAPDFQAHWLDRDVSSDEISLRVGSRLDMMLEDTASTHHRGTRVELVAPLDLIAEVRAERWQSGRTRGGRLLGAVTEVVYRAEEVLDRQRAEVRRVQERFAGRWTLLARERQGKVFDLFHSGELDERLIAKRLDDGTVVGLSVPRGLDQTFLSVTWAMRTGVPVIIWHSGGGGRAVGDWLSPVQREREVIVSSDDIENLPRALLLSRSGRVLPSDYGYIEESFEIAVMYHDTLPVLPESPPPMSTDSIR